MTFPREDNDLSTSAFAELFQAGLLLKVLIKSLDTSLRRRLLKTNTHDNVTSASLRHTKNTIMNLWRKFFYF